MAITLITGIPGHGKTLLMVGRMIDKIIPETKAEGRQVFHNIDGFDPGEGNDHVHHVDYDFFSVWHQDDAPRDAVYVVDEAQFLCDVRNPAAKVPDHVKFLTIHRRRGLDIYLITQNGSLIDRFVHPLIEEHSDVYRPYGMKFSRVTTFPYYAETTKHRASLQLAQTDRLTFKKEHFDRYRSATRHTMTAKLPVKKLALYASCVLFAVGGIGGGAWYMAVGTSPGEASPALTYSPGEDGPAQMRVSRCPRVITVAVGGARYHPDKVHSSFRNYLNACNT